VDEREHEHRAGKPGKPAGWKTCPTLGHGHYSIPNLAGAGINQPSPDSSPCSDNSDANPPHPGPNDRMIPSARTVDRCVGASGSPPDRKTPSNFSRFGKACNPPAAAAPHAHGWASHTRHEVQSGFPDNTEAPRPPTGPFPAVSANTHPAPHPDTRPPAPNTTGTIPPAPATSADAWPPMPVEEYSPVPP